MEGSLVLVEVEGHHGGQVFSGQSNLGEGGCACQMIRHLADGDPVGAGTVFLSSGEAGKEGSDEEVGEVGFGVH